MVEIAYLTGNKADTSDKFFVAANAYFTHVFKSKKGSVVKWVNNLDGILADLAKASVTYDVVHIVSHGEAHGTLYFHSSASSTENLQHPELESALENWDNPAGAFCRPLWARLPAGGLPVAVGPATIIQIDGCDIGLCPLYISTFGEMFALNGTIRAPLRIATFFGPPLAVMSQARMLSFIDKLDIALPTDKSTAAERAAFNTYFADEWMKRILAEPESKSDAKTLKTHFRPVLEKHVAQAQMEGFDDLAPYLRRIWLNMKNEIMEKLTEEVARERIVYAEMPLEPIPYFGSEPEIAEDAMFPIRNLVDKCSVRVKETMVKVEVVDGKTGKVTGTKEYPGTLVTTSGTWLQLIVPVRDATGTAPITADPTDPTHYRTVMFTSRAAAPVAP